ncbi:MAG TPA: hypothetical protein IGS52_08800 [Oscillatoriaceae cyanobacterium M33_DOE_052]|nr:hypothetical protein [Oscillatoriaceae cyanobacterium M33_DOE_052]
MFQAKLFKNGNSVVLALPEEIRKRYNWNVGDIIFLNDFTPPSYEDFHVITAYKPPQPSKENPPHAPKTHNKTR